MYQFLQKYEAAQLISAENSPLITAINYILQYITIDKLFKIVIIFPNISLLFLLCFWSNKCSLQI